MLILLVVQSSYLTFTRQVNATTQVKEEPIAKDIIFYNKNHDSDGDEKEDYYDYDVNYSWRRRLLLFLLLLLTGGLGSGFMI